MDVSVLKEDQMKHVLWIFALLFCLSVLSGCGGSSNAATLPAEAQFVVLKEGYLTESGVHTKKQAKVISTQADYATELAIYTSVAPGPVDFTNGKVLLVDMGSRSSMGYSIRVASIDVADSWVVVNVELVKPGPQCIVGALLSNPYQFNFIPTMKEILLSENVVVTTCSP